MNKIFSEMIRAMKTKQNEGIVILDSYFRQASQQGLFEGGDILEAACHMVLG